MHKNLLYSVILDTHFAKCFRVGIDWKSHGQLYPHQDHKQLTYSAQVNLKDNLAIYSTDFTETRLISESNISLPPWTIAVGPTKCTIPVKTNQEKLTNVMVNSFLYIQSQCLYVMSIICKLPEKTLKKILLFVISLGYEDTKVGKDHTLPHLIPVKYESVSADDENSSEKVIHNISAVVSETKVEM